MISETIYFYNLDNIYKMKIHVDTVLEIECPFCEKTFLVPNVTVCPYCLTVVYEYTDDASKKHISRCATRGVCDKWGNPTKKDGRTKSKYVYRRID